MKNSEQKHPRQPIGWDDHGVIRFKKNAIVDWMLEMGRRGMKFDLNDIVMLCHNKQFDFSDLVQLDQLVGYSVSGFGDLSYVPEEEVAACDEIAMKLAESAKHK